MADPYIVGVSSGAGLGATVAMSLGLNFWFYGLSGVGLLAFIGALGVTAVVYGISLRGGRMPVTVVLLSGIALGALASSLTSYLMVAVRDDLFDTQRILLWLMGSLASRRWEHVHMAWPQIALGALCIQWLARDLNILTQGEEYALYLGLDVERNRRRGGVRLQIHCDDDLLVRQVQPLRNAIHNPLVCLVRDQPIKLIDG